MSDEPNRNEAGQFTEAPPLTGREGVEAAQGYVPLDLGDKPDELPPIALDDLLESGDLKPFTENDADSALSMPESEIKRYGTALDDLPDNVSITLEQAAQITSEEKAAEAKEAEEAEQAKIRAEVDALRGVQPAEQISPEIQAMVDQGLSVETAKAIAIPEVRTALESEFQKFDQVREQYASSLHAGQQMLQATVAALAPQLAEIPLENWPQAIQMLEQVDPVRAQLVADTLHKWGGLQQAEAQAQQHQTRVQYQNFENHVRSEDAKLVKMIGKESADQANNATISYLRQFGVPENQLVGVFMQNPALRTAEARELIYKAAQYDKMQSAPRPAKSIPPVHKPGVARDKSAGTERSSQVRSLEAQLSTATGERAARISAQIYGLQKRGR
jgi:hypothetical protein